MDVKESLQQVFAELRTILAVEPRNDTEAASRAEDVRRTLHSLKSLAAYARDDELESRFHELEDAMANADPDVLDDLRSTLLALESKPGPRGATAPQQGNALVTMPLPPLPFDAKLSRIIDELRHFGRPLNVLRVWVSPDELMPYVRLAVLRARLEESGILAFEEAWVSVEGEPRSVDPLDSGAFESVQGNALLYRVLHSPTVTERELAQALDVDQVEFLSANAWTDPDSLVPATRRSEELFLDIRRLLLRGRADGLVHTVSRVLGSSVLETLRPRMEESVSLAGLGALRIRLWSEEIEMREFALSNLVQAILQLVRNSLAHGVQDARTRSRQGKSGALNLEVGIFRDGNTVRIRVNDDGAGIDHKAVAERSGRDTFLFENDELLDILCTGGFSTSREVDTSSGRGYGLSLVRHLCENVLRGKLSLQSRGQNGTCFEMAVPSDLFELGVVVVQFDDETVAVPQIATLKDIPGVRVDQDESGAFVAVSPWGLHPVSARKSHKIEDLRSCKLLPLAARGRLKAFLPYHSLRGEEKVLVTVDANSAYSRQAQAWIPLVTFES